MEEQTKIMHMNRIIMKKTNMNSKGMDKMKTINKSNIGQTKEKKENKKNKKNKWR